MDQFVLVLASEYSKSLSPSQLQIIKFQSSKLYKIPRTKLIHISKDINKLLFAEPDSLVDKILSCPRVRLPNSQTLKLDGLKLGIFLSDFAQQLRRKNANLSDIYSTLHDAADISTTLFLTQNAETRESWVPFKI